jgi:hypothetical protein
VNFLTDVLPPKARKYVYAVLALAAVVLGVWQASDGDWLLFAANLLGALGFGTAASNVKAGYGEGI